MSLAHQIRVVLQSYLTRTGFRWAVIALISGFAASFGSAGIWQLCKHAGYDSEQLHAMLWIPFGLGLYSVMFSLGGALLLFFIHARQQLMGSSARLLPDGRTANLIVAGALFFTITGLILTYIVWIDEGRSSWFGMFLVILTFMILTAMAVAKPWLIPVPIALAWLWPGLGPFAHPHGWEMVAYGMLVDHTPDYRVAPNKVEADFWEYHGWFVLTLRIVVVLANILGLIILEKLARPRAQRRSVVSRLRAAFSWESRPQHYLVLPHRVITSHWPRVMHRRNATHNWRMTIAIAVATSGLTLLLILGYGPRLGTPALPVLLTLLPGVLLALSWRERWPSHEFELLYPATRTQYAAEQLSGMLLDAVEFWLASAVALVLTLLAILPRILTDAQFLAMLLGSGMLQFTWIGAIVLVGQRRQTTPFVAALMLIGVIIFMTFSGIDAHGGAFPTRFMFATSAEMLLGLAMIAFSKFTWRRSRIA